MSDSKAESDEYWVQRAQRGDRAAFDVLVRKYQFRIAKLVSRYVRDSAEVWDISQEVFVRAYVALKKFRGDSAFYTWLYRIAINTAKNHVASAARRPRDVELEGAESQSAVGGAETKDGASPERLLMRDEVESVVFGAIDALPMELRTTILLRELDGMTYQEIASVMNCPVGTVRSRIFRARECIDSELRLLLDNNN